MEAMENLQEEGKKSDEIGVNGAPGETILTNRHCDMPYRPKDDSLKNMTFWELELKFNHLVNKSDTIEFTFNFYDGNKVVIATGLRDIITMNTGVGYDRKTRTKIYMSSPDGFVIYQKGGHNRYENIFQPEVSTKK